MFQHGKGASLVPRYDDTKSFTPSPPQKKSFGPKPSNLAQNQNFWPKTSILTHLIPCRPKNNADKLPRCFYAMWVPKLLLTPIKLGFFALKRPNLVIFGQIFEFFANFIPRLTKMQWNKVPRQVFRYVGNKTFDFSSKNQDFLPKSDQIWPKIGIFGQFGPGHAGLFCALLVGRLVVVARGLYLARHLFTLWIMDNYPLCRHFSQEALN